MRLLAETIKKPFEVWLVPAKLDGNDHESLRFIRLFRETGGGKIGGLGIFHWLPGKGWHGATVFNPYLKAGQEAPMLRYLEKRRAGVLLFREQ
jgi:hypothetical protein